MKNRVKEFREEQNLTQEELSKKSGVSRNTINVNVTYEVMEKIAMALKKKVSSIFF